MSEPSQSKEVTEKVEIQEPIVGSSEADIECSIKTEANKASSIEPEVIATLNDQLDRVEAELSLKNDKTQSDNEIKAEEKKPEVESDETHVTQPKPIETKEEKCQVDEKPIESETKKSTPPPDQGTRNTVKKTQSPKTMSQTPEAPAAGFRRPTAAKAAPQTEAAKIKETILNWCIQKTQDYPNVQISNFSSSWNNGVSFCALVHHFCPDAFDFNMIDPKNRKGNFELAFKVAEDKCDISPLLEAEDMILMGNKPDARCIFTYLSTFYQKLELMPAAKAAAAAKRNEA